MPIEILCTFNPVVLACFYVNICVGLTGVEVDILIDLLEVVVFGCALFGVEIDVTRLAGISGAVDAKGGISTFPGITTFADGVCGAWCC